MTRLVNVKRIAGPTPSGLSTRVNSGRSLTLRVVAMMSSALTTPTTIIATCSGSTDGEVPALGRNSSGMMKPSSMPSRPKSDPETWRPVRSASDSVTSGSSAE